MEGHQHSHTRTTEVITEKPLSTIVVEEQVQTPEVIELVPEENAQTNNESTFVNRVSSFPIVQDSFSTVHAIANKTSLGRFALSTANSTFSVVTKYSSSQPKYVQDYYESYIQPHVQKADQLGCRSLDIIQDKFPVVNESTSSIVKRVTEPSYQIVDGVKVKIDSSFKQPAVQVAKEANKRFESVVDNVEAVIDRYLPQSQVTDRSAEQVNQAVRAYYLLNDASLRLSQRVSDQIKTSTEMIPRSRDDISRLTDTSAFVQKTTANIQALQESLAQSITLYAQSAQQHLPLSVTEKLQVIHSTTTDRLQNITQQVSTQVQQLVDYIKTQSKTETPEWLKARVLSLVEIANKQIEIIRAQFSRVDISSLDKAKNVAQALQSQVLPILQNIQSQLNYYTEAARQKAQTDLKFPLEYLGLTYSAKVAQA
ncbi:hypothetical protein K501DRAFT_284124 [Backusella circina FSU 941]|nr:hypothetical protein K501DRAFT_284124 [Backusella circina FSU 941]